MARIFQCTVKVLDDQVETSLVIDFKKDAKGQFLLDEACSRQNLAEKDYFGLRYIDGEKQRHWLDLKKSIVKQLRGTGPPYTVVFRIKFYPANPDDLKEEITRYQLFMQLKKDLFHGRLVCSREDSALLGSYIVQSNLGDYDPAEHPPGYVSGYQIIPKQTERLEKRLEELHEKHTSGLTPSDAEVAFIKKAFTLETYGVDPHPVRDIYGTALHIGMTHVGLLVFRANAVVETFKWPEVRKFSYEGRTFFIHAIIDERNVNHGFRLPTSAATKHLWKSALDHQAFYNPGSRRRRRSSLLLGFRRSSDVSSHTSGGFFRGSRFRFSGRTQKEVLEKSRSLSREEPTFARSPPMIRPRRVQSFRETSALHPPCEITFDGFSQLSGSDQSTPIKMNDPFMTYAPAPLDSTDDSDMHADSEDMIDAATPTIQEEPYEQQAEEETKQEAPWVYQEPQTNHIKDKPIVDKPHSSSGRCSKVLTFTKVTFCCVVLALILLTVSLVVLYETDHIPTLDPLRQNESIREFKEAYYVPVRGWIEEGWEQVSEGYQQLPSMEEWMKQIGIINDGEAKQEKESQ
ncbi:FERM domain-containing protein 5-like isoform X1 [Asterias rubens]|uniref:FERM domain-containing protein 5-like isoform X1 n=1 Tax=Asterias rubens TaxID=7604 RepID=UPI001455D537|nr:FERM domain-containing protein 5-like isoform X1 [Asterias rubens]